MSYNDYGIGWDDEWSRSATGHANFNYIFHNDQSLLTNNEKYHGPFVELLLVVAEKAIGLTDTAAIYQMRHFLLFLLFFLAVISFYSIIKDLFGMTLGILGCLMLVLSPRIFSEAFFNSKDLAFLSLFTISLFYYIKFVKNPNIRLALIFGVISGALIATRILGIMMPLITIAYVLLHIIIKKLPKGSAILLLLYFFITTLSVILFWPILWANPLHHFTEAFVEMKKFHWQGHVFFNNQPIHTSDLPWYYLPIWIFITTPLIYNILFAFGFLLFTRKLIINPFKELLNEFEIFSIFVLLIAPIAAVILLNSVVYDGWRHVFFVYPLFLVMALYGVDFFKKYLNNLKYLKYSLFAFFIINMFYIGFWMANNHPHQNVYFNAFSREKFNVGKKFELDYWGLSYKQGLTYLHKNVAHSDTIVFTALNLPGTLNKMVMPAEYRERFKFVEQQDSSWVYFLTNYRGGGDPENTKLMHKIMVDDIPILGIYQRIGIEN
jgi:hypothetical protein